MEKGGAVGQERSESGEVSKVPWTATTTKGEKAVGERVKFSDGGGKRSRSDDVLCC